MDCKGQTAVLSLIFVLVGMMFLVPAITEKSLASVYAVVTGGSCGPPGKTHQCQYTLVDYKLQQGKWVKEPTKSGTAVSWETSSSGTGEVGTVTYKLEGGIADLFFSNRNTGSNTYTHTCDVIILSGKGQLFGACCCSGSGQTPDWRLSYTLYSRNVNS